MATTATMKQIRAGLVSNLSSLGIQSTGYVLSAPTPPSIEIFPAETDYDQAFQRGLDYVDLIVRITVTTAIDIGSQDRLDEYLAPSGTGSVKTLIEASKTLGGIVQDVHVQGHSGYTVVASQGGLMLYCDFQVRVFA